MTVSVTGAHRVLGSPCRMTFITHRVLCIAATTELCLRDGGGRSLSVSHSNWVHGESLLAAKSFSMDTEECLLNHSHRWQREKGSSSFKQKRIQMTDSVKHPDRAQGTAETPGYAVICHPLQVSSCWIQTSTLVVYSSTATPWAAIHSLASWRSLSSSVCR